VAGAKNRTYRKPSHPFEGTPGERQQKLVYSTLEAAREDSNNVLSGKGQRAILLYPLGRDDVSPKGKFYVYLFDFDRSLKACLFIELVKDAKQFGPNKFIAYNHFNSKLVSLVGDSHGLVNANESLRDQALGAISKAKEKSKNGTVFHFPIVEVDYEKKEGTLINGEIKKVLKGEEDSSFLYYKVDINNFSDIFDPSTSSSGYGLAPPTPPPKPIKLGEATIKKRNKQVENRAKKVNKQCYEKISGFDPKLLNYKSGVLLKMKECQKVKNRLPGRIANAGTVKSFGSMMSKEMAEIVRKKVRNVASGGVKLKLGKEVYTPLLTSKGQYSKNLFDHVGVLSYLCHSLGFVAPVGEGNSYTIETKDLKNQSFAIKSEITFAKTPGAFMIITNDSGKVMKIFISQGTGNVVRKGKSVFLDVLATTPYGYWGGVRVEFREKSGKYKYFQEKAVGSLSLQQQKAIIDFTAFWHEAGRRGFGAFRADDTGQGTSFGRIQFNQVRGTLFELIKRMQERNPKKFEEIFGKEDAALITNPKLFDENRRIKESNRRTIKFTDDLKTPNELGKKLIKTAEVSDFQQAQYDMSIKYYYLPAEKLAGEFKITNGRNIAILFDAAVQIGPAGLRRRLRATERKVPIASNGEQAFMDELAQLIDLSIPYAHHPRRMAMLSSKTSLKLEDFKKSLTGRFSQSYLDKHGSFWWNKRRLPYLAGKQAYTGILNELEKIKVSGKAKKESTFLNISHMGVLKSMVYADLLKLYVGFDQ